MNGQLAPLAILTLIGIVVGTAILVLWKLRRIVTENSVALAALQSLNRNYQQRLKYPSPMVYSWEDRVNSKAKLVRYDLHKFFLARLAVLEDQIRSQIAAQINDVSVYAEYYAAYKQICTSKLGRSAYERMNREAFAWIEKKLFAKRMLRAPLCVAQVRCIVRYTSPKGQNSYSRELGWDFQELQSGLTEMKQIQEARSTATFLRQQERNRMSASLRYQVLSRDDSRCRRCGGTP
ncbi:hypothetical protein A9W93_14055 [Mycobacterium colombiense]|nr:hypothetical protein A9W93_14055 [Mycobacterium colombiense]